MKMQYLAGVCEKKRASITDGAGRGKRFIIKEELYNLYIFSAGTSFSGFVH